MADKLNILIVEDEPLIAMLLEDFLETLGHNVAHCCESVEDALEAAKDPAVQFAILDVNIGGDPVWPVATQLRERDVPFAIATGGHVTDPPAEFENVATLSKPYTIDRIEPVIDVAMGSKTA